MSIGEEITQNGLVCYSKVHPLTQMSRLFGFFLLSIYVRSFLPQLFANLAYILVSLVVSLRLSRVDASPSPILGKLGIHTPHLPKILFLRQKVSPGGASSVLFKLPSST